MYELPDSPNIKQCKTCGEDIKSTAKKCIHCDSFQELRRYLPFSNTMIALIIALVSVVAAVSPVLKKVFTEQDSNIIVRLQEVVWDSIHLIASNLGEKDGAIGITGITVKTTQKEKYAWRTRLDKHREETFIEAKSSKQVRLYLKRETEKDYEDIKKYRNWYFRCKDSGFSPKGFVELEIITFKGNKKTKIVDLERPGLESFLNNSLKK